MKRSSLRNRKTMTLAIVLGALVMFGGAGTARADSRGREEACYRNVRQQEYELNRAIDRYGFRSRQADHERRDVERAREKCRIIHERESDRDRYR
jgi:hypothetical protein